MLRTIAVMSVALAAALSPVLSDAQTRSSGSQLVQVTPGGGRPTTPALNFTPVPGASNSKVNCGASNAHYKLCTEIKAACDSIHETAPSHPCGCTTNSDGNLGDCETGV